MNFTLIGASGYIAPRHFKAIRDTNNILLAAVDRFDSVGVLDSFFPKADFFVEFERFDRHVEKLRSRGVDIDYTTVCTPNYLHDAHIRFALRSGSNAICEKPLVLNPWNIDALEKMEELTGKRIWNILQLRVHPTIISLKNQIENGPQDKIYDIDLTYLTSRGNWYYTSWKGDVQKSGGIATNIGVHFFDMLAWIFGSVTSNTVHLNDHDRAAGFLELKRARVRWFLSINADLLPNEIKSQHKTTYRSIVIDGKELEFSDGFTDLHTACYKDIVDGKGYGISETRSAIQTVYEIRNSKPRGPIGEYHSLAKADRSAHPFDKTGKHG